MAGKADALSRIIAWEDSAQGVARLTDGRSFLTV